MKAPAIVFLILTILAAGLGIYLFISAPNVPGDLNGYAGLARSFLGIGLFVLAFIFGIISLICFICWLCPNDKWDDE